MRLMVFGRAQCWTLHGLDINTGRTIKQFADATKIGGVVDSTEDWT